MLFAIALLAVACGSDEDAESIGTDESLVVTAISPRGVEAPGAVIANTEWELVDGAPLVDGYAPTIWFSSDSSRNQAVVGHGPCNRFGGEVVLGEGTINVGGLDATAAGCATDELTLSENQFFRLLPEVETFRVDNGQLILSGAIPDLVFEAIQSPLTDDIVDRQWILETTVSGGVSSEPVGKAAGLLLNSDGTVRYGTGCETTLGYWHKSGPYLDFNGGLYSEDDACNEDLIVPADEQEILVNGILGRTRATLDGDRLTLSSRLNQLIYGLDTLGQVPAPRTGSRVNVPLGDIPAASDSTLKDATFRFDGVCAVAETGGQALLVWPEGSVKGSVRAVVFTSPESEEAVRIEHGEVVTFHGTTEIQRTNFTVQPHPSCPTHNVFFVTSIDRPSSNDQRSTGTTTEN